MASGERVPSYYRNQPSSEETEPVTDFYEDDEPVADVVAAFESAPKGLTGGAADPATEADDAEDER